MVVAPVPTQPHSPLRRVARLVGLVLPVALLVAVVGGGLLGQASERGAGVAPTASPAATPAPSPAGGATAATAAPSATAVGPRGIARWEGPRATFPKTIAGLPVRGVAATLALRRSGGATGVIAVAGYLVPGALPPRCTDAAIDTAGAPCGAGSMIVDAPNVTDGTATAGAGASGAGGFRPHLHPQLPPGVRGPLTATSAHSAEPVPTPIVVLGELGGARALPCDPAARRCDEAFVVERVVWRLGKLLDATITVDPALPTDATSRTLGRRARSASARLGRDAFVLATTLVRPSTLALLDPVAGRAIETIDAGSRPAAVWYVRALSVPPVPTSDPPAGAAHPVVTWAVVDDATRGVLAAGSDAARSEPPATP